MNDFQGLAPTSGGELAQHWAPHPFPSVVPCNCGKVVPELSVPVCRGAWQRSSSHPWQVYTQLHAQQCVLRSGLG